MGAARTAIACWAGEALLPVLRALIEDGRFSIVAVGGTTAEGREIAAALDVPHHDDPRLLATTPDAEAVVLMDPDRRLSAEELVAVMSAAQDRPLLTMATRSGAVGALMDEASDWPVNAPLPRPVPWFRGLGRGRRLLEAMAAFGTPLSASVEVTGPGPEGMLATRLLDGFDLLGEWFGFPVVVDACGLRAPGAGDGGVGRLLVLARYADGRAASVIAGADGGRHQRSVTLHGEAGRLRMVDGGIDWSDEHGRSVEFEAPGPPCGRDLADDLADSIEAIVRGLVPPRPRDVTLELLAVCEACMLSMRTGEPETIERVRRMLGRV